MTREERKANKEKMLSMIEQWHNSGLTQKDFCRQQSIPDHIFHYWLRIYRDQQQPAGFISLAINKPEPITSPIEICYPNGVVLRIPSNSQLSFLKQLIKF